MSKVASTYASAPSAPVRRLAFWSRKGRQMSGIFKSFFPTVRRWFPARLDPSLNRGGPAFPQMHLGQDRIFLQFAGVTFTHGSSPDFLRETREATEKLLRRIGQNTAREGT